MRLLAALGFLLQATQADPDDLISRLHSEKIEDRDQAAMKLIELGNMVRPRIVELLREPDKEVAGRAANILRELERREQLSALRAAGRVRTVDLKHLPREEALRKLFDGYGLQSRIDLQFPAPDSGLVTLQLKDAGFWEVVDQFCAAANVRYEPKSWICAESTALTFTRPLPWPVYFATLGDVRIYATLVVLAGGGDKHGDITARLSAVFPPWVLPKLARIEEVTIAGQLVEEDECYRKARMYEGALPVQKDKLTAIDLWHGGDSVRRASLKSSPTVSVEATIVVPSTGSNVPNERRIPFSIPRLLVPPVPAR